MGYSPSLTCIANRLKAIKAKRSIVPVRGSSDHDRSTHTKDDPRQSIIHFCRTVFGAGFGTR